MKEIKINVNIDEEQNERKTTISSQKDKSNKRSKKLTNPSKVKTKHHSFLLFKNATKQAFRNKIQLIGLAVLVLLSSTIFSLMQTSLARIAIQYNALISEQQSNIHDFILDPYNTAKLTNNLDQPEHPKHPDDEIATIEDQQLYLNEIAYNSNNSFVWERVETRTFQLNNNNNPKVLKLITYNKDSRIDKLVISQGFNIGENPNEKVPTEKQTVINKEFANKNNLKIGDVIRVQLDNKGESLKVNFDITNSEYDIYNWLKIVGFGSSADFITPIIDQTTPLPNKTKEGILYVDPAKFGFASRLKVDKDGNILDANNETDQTIIKDITKWNSLWFHNKNKDLINAGSSKDTEVYYVGKSTMSKKNNLAEISNFFKARYINTSNSTANLIYRLGDSNYRFNNRTATLPKTIQSFKSLLIALLLIVLIITGITVILITFKNIDNSKPQIGILKSLGYSNWKILITSLAYPMIAALIGTIFVFLPASGLQVLVVNTFANYFNLNFGKFIFNGLGYLYCLILTFGFLSIIAWIISTLTVIKNPIVLIKNISKTRDSKFTKYIKKSSANAKFLTRFRLALFTSSIGKMSAVFLTMFLGTTLLTTAIIGPKIMNDNQKVTYTGMNYKNLTEYVNPTYNSPFSFYKTYNPNIKPWEYETENYDNGTSYTHPKRSNEEFAQNLLDNSINSEAYAPISPDPSNEGSLLTLSMNSLSYLYGKMITKDFLAGLDASSMNPTLIGIILNLAWPESLPIFNLANATDNIYKLENYQSVRTFYINYRSTIAMDLNPEVRADNDKNQLNKDYFKTFVSSAGGWNTDVSNFTRELTKFEFDKSDAKYPWHIANEQELFANPTPTKNEMQNQWIRKILIWFYALFYNRVGEAVAQGTYTKSPYFIRQNLATAFENLDSKFNVSFNVVPFAKETDELGTYFVGTPDKQFNDKQYPIKVYGLQNEKQLEKKSLMQLYNNNGYSLNDTLERTNDNGAINIVINQTIAKQLKMKENQEFWMAPNGNILMTNQDPNYPNKYTKIDVDKIKFSNINNNDDNANPLAGENNVSLLTQNTTYDQIPNTTNNGAYYNIGIDATSMLKEINQGNVVINHDTEMYKFKIAGIYNGYGQPTAYISKDNADKLLHYNEAKETLYQIFKREWQSKGTVNTNGTNIDFESLKNMESYRDFDENVTDEVKPLKTIFNNEFPIFNFKFSNFDELVDITETFSISQAYGDYSALGMNGGLDQSDVNGKIYPVYGDGTAVNVLPLYIHKQLLEQITQLVDTVLLFFIIFSLIISFFIILLTSNLVIYENRKIIATMKTLGYSNAKITNIVIGMYLPIILATWIIGVPIGWIIISSIIKYLAYNTTWVLPLFFTWWLPIIIGLVVLTIYAITFVIEWQATKKIQPLKILNESN